MYVKEAAASSIVPDGLHRGNEDQGWAATSTATDHQSNSGLLRHCIDQCIESEGSVEEGCPYLY